MSDEQPPCPPWIAAEMWVWLSRFGMDEYRMRVLMDPTEQPHEARKLGEATVHARYLTALLTFSTELKEDDEGRHVVAHECGHVLLGELSQVVEHLIHELPTKSAQSIAYEMWHDASDRTIERLTRALEGQFKP